LEQCVGFDVPLFCPQIFQQCMPMVRHARLMIPVPTAFFKRLRAVFLQTGRDETRALRGAFEARTGCPGRPKRRHSREVGPSRRKANPLAGLPHRTRGRARWFRKPRPARVGSIVGCPRAGRAGAADRRAALWVRDRPGRSARPRSRRARHADVAGSANKCPDPARVAAGRAAGAICPVSGGAYGFARAARHAGRFSGVCFVIMRRFWNQACLTSLIMRHPGIPWRRGGARSRCTCLSLYSVLESSCRCSGYP